MRIFEMLVAKRVPYNTFDSVYWYSSTDFSGGSFLLNPHDLLYYSYKYNYTDIAIYLSLASLRSYAHYKLFRDTTLDLDLAPTDPRNHLKNQNLLSVRNGSIHFLYEELTGENNGTCI